MRIKRECPCCKHNRPMLDAIRCFGCQLHCEGFECELPEHWKQVTS